MADAWLDGALSLLSVLVMVDGHVFGAIAMAGTLWLWRGDARRG